MPDKKCFCCSVKDGRTNGNGEKLNGHKCDEDYLACNKIWNKFNMKNMGDYLDHYLKKDVLLLADVSEKFIDTCLKFYKLDSLSLFQFSWIELVCDVKNDCCQARKNFRHWHLFVYWKRTEGRNFLHC